jgi:hypothetical protein
MAYQTLHDAYVALNTTHWLYNRNRDRWEFLYHSYAGGEEYRKGGYLTKYQLETAAEFQQRLMNTPLDNQCQSVIQTYISFLFRNLPERDFGSWEGLPQLEDFLKDCDREGRNFNSFMKQVSIWASVFGSAWVIMTKPNVGAQTLAQEQALGVRPYINLLTPLAVSDWSWQRDSTGRYELNRLRYIEEIMDSITIIKEWDLTSITTYEMNEVKKEARVIDEQPNLLNRIPAILVYNQRSVTRDLGISDITDIADIQRQIYCLLSEQEQQIRIDGHPTLVTPVTANVGSGAGAIIQLQDGSDGALNPYYLEAGGISVDNIHNSIDKLVESIDRMAFTGGVRAKETRTMSGVAMEVEFNLLSAKLADKADQLELAEEQIWELWALYQQTEFTGSIKYPDTFSIQDDDREMNQLLTAKNAASDPIVLKIIDGKILELLGEEKELLSYDDLTPVPGRTYSDGTPIPDSLPPAYQLSTNSDVPQGQNCANCEYYKSTEQYCIKFDAAVRPVFWCAKWEPKEDTNDLADQ